MNLSRRGFLGGIIAAAAAPVIIKTAGLLMPIKPGLIAATEQTFVVTDSVSSECLLTINGIIRKAVRSWKNSSAFIKQINNQYDEAFNFAVGDILHIRLPNQFSVTAK